MRLPNEFIDSVKDKILMGTSKRFNCPECGSGNSLSITKTVQAILYCCFDASCDISGKVGGTNNPREVVNIMKNKDVPTIIKPWYVPEYFVYGAVSDRAYDPKQDRIVFFIIKDGIIIGGHGRKQYWKKGDPVPKWYKYGNTSWPYLADPYSTYRTGIIVEDALSALSASDALDDRSINGIALGGTELPEKTGIALRNYHTIWVALDRDASRKAFKIADELRSYNIPNVKIKLLTEDIKYLSKEKIRSMF